MQIKLFTIPILQTEDSLTEMNAFLRSQKVLKVEQHLTRSDESSYWCFAISYIARTKTKSHKKERIDYKEVLTPVVFEQFSRLRKIRKELAQQESIPAFVIFSDRELADLAQFEQLTLAAMRKVAGVGDKKIEKYGRYFISTDEANRESYTADQ